MRTFNMTATGNGEFPWDMLRYDECWPENSASAMRMAAPVVPGTSAEERKFWSQPRTVYLTSHKRPTPERWASFNWICTYEERA